jgi:hypothetical protein
MKDHPGPEIVHPNRISHSEKETRVLQVSGNHTEVAEVPSHRVRGKLLTGSRIQMIRVLQATDHAAVPSNRISLSEKGTRVLQVNGNHTEVAEVPSHRVRGKLLTGKRIQMIRVLQATDHAAAHPDRINHLEKETRVLRMKGPKNLISHSKNGRINLSGRNGMKETPVRIRLRPEAALGSHHLMSRKDFPKKPYPATAKNPGEENQKKKKRLPHKRIK